MAILSAAGVHCVAMPPDIDEQALKQVFPGPASALPGALALAKARAISTRMPDALVIGADQILLFNGRLFDKPHSLAVAAAQLRELSGQTHELIASVCLMRGGAPLWQHSESASLTMRPFSEAFLTDYLAAEGEALLHSVGAYRLEGLGAQLFEHVRGDYFTVLGLPLLALLGTLRAEGVLKV